MTLAENALSKPAQSIHSVNIENEASEHNTLSYANEAFLCVLCVSADRLTFD